MKRRLLITSASVRTREIALKKAPAIEVFDGIFARSVRKYVREELIHPGDILFVSPTLGLIPALKDLDSNEVDKATNWHRPKVNQRELTALNKDALCILKNMTMTKYTEVFVNVGKNLYPIIAGINKIFPYPIIQAEGRGIGPKAAHMKAWVLNNRAE